MHPNSIANLRAPWKPGERPPSPGPSKLERALKISQDAAPKAARLIARTVDDPEVPISLRLRCAEYLLDKALPTPKGATALSIGAAAGVEWLELRFTAPGGASESHRIDLEPNVVESMGQIIDAEPEASDIKDIEHE